jgi:hypothetical protein
MKPTQNTGKKPLGKNQPYTKNDHKYALPCLYMGKKGNNDSVVMSGEWIKQNCQGR